MKHTFYVDQLNIGGSLNSLLYSYLTETHLLIENSLPPFELDEIDHNYDLSFLGFNRGVPLKSVQVWDRLSFILSMAGLMIVNDGKIRYEHDNVIIVLPNNRRISVQYNKINKMDQIKTGYSHVYDWFDVNSGGKHKETVYFNDREQFVNELIFYQSNRPNVRGGIKDVVAVSFLKDSSIMDIENSEIYSKLKTLSIMKKLGIKGTKNGYDSRGQSVYKAIKIDHAYREIRPQLKEDHPMSELLKLPINKDSALCKLTKKLFKPVHST